jgi:hypothetical protein
MKVRTALGATLSLLGVKVPTQAQLLEAMTFLNIMVNEWSGDDLTIYEYVEETFSLVVGQGSYTFGTGGDFSSERPLTLESAYLKNGANKSYEVNVVSRDEYNRIYNKTTTGRPERIFYAAEFPLGKIYTDLVADDTYSLVLTTAKVMQDITGLDDDILLPQNYEQAIIYNLAINMVDVHRSKLSSLTVATAVNSKLKVEEASKKPIAPVGFGNVLPGVSEEVSNEFTTP